MKERTWIEVITPALATLAVLAFFEWLTVREEKRYAEALAAGEVEQAGYHAQRARMFAVICGRKRQKLPKVGEGY